MRFRTAARLPASGQQGALLSVQRALPPYYRVSFLAAAASCGLRALKANRRAAARDGMETHLRHEPTKTSRSRIKRLRGASRPQYRLRIEDVRIFYDVTHEAVEVLAIVPKAQAAAWLKRHAEPRKPAVGKNGGTTS